MDFIPQDSYNYDELIACGKGELFGPENAQLPLPPMLMFDRITTINDHGGNYNNGKMIAEFDIKDNLWFFDCHFENDPVMPGCLGLDALWQLVGFFLGWSGNPGKGRALGVGDVKFSGQILPDADLVTYEVDIKRVINRSLVLGVGDGTVRADGEVIYKSKNLKVGLFQPDELSKKL